jgi:uncharacterized membrane protein YkvA (DUF1232 family)
MNFLDLRATARRIKRDGVTLWFACRDARTPWWIKALAGLVVAYALSPIDLVPDFIPVLGYLDDVILLPGLIWLVVRLMPSDVRDDCRQQAEAWMAQPRRKLVSRWGLLLVLVVWALLAWALWRWWA